MVAPVQRVYGNVLGFIVFCHMTTVFFLIPTCSLAETLYLLSSFKNTKA